MLDENLIMIIVWAAIFLISLVVELSTDALVSVWFCLGALFAAAVTYIPGMPWWGELLVFLGVSLLSFLIIRPLVRRKLLRMGAKTNVDSLLGKKGVVLKEIAGLEKGEVKIGGLIWSAVQREGEKKIGPGEIVEVISIQGNKLLVKRSQKEEK